jgi:hypothetical protein
LGVNNLVGEFKFIDISRVSPSSPCSLAASWLSSDLFYGAFASLETLVVSWVSAEATTGSDKRE